MVLRRKDVSSSTFCELQGVFARPPGDSEKSQDGLGKALTLPLFVSKRPVGILTQGDLASHIW